MLIGTTSDFADVSGRFDVWAAVVRAPTVNLLHSVASVLVERRAHVDRVRANPELAHDIAKRSSASLLDLSRSEQVR
jgi:hypothetical protein